MRRNENSILASTRQKELRESIRACVSLLRSLTKTIPNCAPQWLAQRLKDRDEKLDFLFLLISQLQECYYEPYPDNPYAKQ